MANPPYFQPGYNYSNWQATNPTKPLPAQRVDNDFANIARSLNASVAAIGDIRRSDGRLQNGVVGPDSLDPSLSLGFNLRGQWQPDTDYQSGDGVVYGQIFYAARVSHTSTPTNNPSNGEFWNFLFSLDDIVIAGALSMPLDQFVSDGVTTEFTLSFTPVSGRNLFVTIGNQLQAVSEYGVNGNKIVFDVAPPTAADGTPLDVIVRAFSTTAGIADIPDGSVTEDKLDTNLSNRLDAAFVLGNMTGPPSDDLNQLITRPKHTRKFKFLLTSDWQPLAADEDPSQIPLQTAMMQDIEQYHSDVDYAFFNGDLIDKPTLGDGTPNLYTYGMLINDIRTNIPSIPWPGRWFPNAGNHDRDGTGAGTWAHAWSLYSYKSEVGPLWYYVDIGNFRFIQLGDMMGSNTGEILPEAMIWFRKVLAFSKSRNVVILMHQPPNPTIYPPSTNPNAASFQRSAAELVSIISSYDNIAYVQYGHVGGTIGNATLITVAYGTTWVNCQMGIPSMVNSGIANNPLVYSLAEGAVGDTTITIRRWNASAHDWLATTTPALANRDVTISLKYPVALSGDVPDFDGRKHFDPQIPYVMSKLVVSASIDDYRGVDGSTPADMVTLELRLNDDANTNVGGNANMVAVYVPGADNTTDADGYQINGVPGGVGGMFGYRRTEATDTNYESAFVVKATNLSGNLEELMTLYTTTDSRAGAYFPLTALVSGVGIGIGDSSSFSTVIDSNRHVRLRTYTAAELAVLSPSPVGMINRTSDGIGGSPGLVDSSGGSGGWYGIMQSLNFVSSTVAPQWPIGPGGTFLTTGTGSPEGVVTAPIGSEYKDRSSGARWTKVTGTGNTGWIGQLYGSGTPETFFAATIGSEYNDITNGVKYMKKTGTGNTGWKLVTQAA